MLVGIMADGHLGMNVFRKMDGMQNVYSALNNQAFKEAIDIFIENKVDILLIPGDLFETPNPSVFSVKLAKEEFKRFKNPVYILGGNHDFSQKNTVMECHAFDLIDNENVIAVNSESQVFEFDSFDLTMIPYKDLNAETYKKIYKGKLSKKEKTSILAIHGYVDLGDGGELEEYCLNKSVASNYDLVTCGHVHLNRLIKTDSTSILTPGSLMPSKQANDKTCPPSVWVFNTDNKDIERIELTVVPKIICINTLSINETLLDISTHRPNNIYQLKYNGKITDIDEYSYKKATENALNISIQTNDQVEFTEIKKVSDFWSFIEDEHSGYFEEFKSILNG